MLTAVSGAWFLFSAESAMVPGQVSWLRSGMWIYAGPPPSPVLMPSGAMAAHLRLQWRDRTGIAPDFPFQPFRAPWVYLSCTTLNQPKVG